MSIFRTYMGLWFPQFFPMQAADIALENDMMEAIDDKIKCVCLVSDDSDFVSVLKKATARNVRTVVVGDVYGDLKVTADANFSWRDVCGWHAQRDDSGLKHTERNHRPKSIKNFEGEEEDDLFESLGSENDDEDDFRLEECNDEGFNSKIKHCTDEVFVYRDKECKYKALETKDKIQFAPEGRRRSENQRKVSPWWKLESDSDD